MAKLKTRRMMKKKVSVIGCGNIGLSIIQGLLRETDYSRQRHYCNKKEYKRDFHALKESGVRVTADNISAIKSSNLIIIAVKPYNIVNVLEEIKDIT